MQREHRHQGRLLRCRSAFPAPRALCCDRLTWTGTEYRVEAAGDLDQPCSMSPIDSSLAPSRLAHSPVRSEACAQARTLIAGLWARASFQVGFHLYYIDAVLDMVGDHFEGARMVREPRRRFRRKEEGQRSLLDATARNSLCETSRMDRAVTAQEATSNCICVSCAVSGSRASSSAGTPASAVQSTFFFWGARSKSGKRTPSRDQDSWLSSFQR